MKTKTDYSNKFVIKKINNVSILHKNDAPIECIYKNPVVLPHPNLSGQAVIKQALCGDLCPMFNIVGEGLFKSVKFECTKYEIEVYEETEMQMIKPNPFK